MKMTMTKKVTMSSMTRTVTLPVTWLRGMPLTILASSMAVQQKGILYWPSRLGRKIIVVQVGKSILCRSGKPKCASR